VTGFPFTGFEAKTEEEKKSVLKIFLNNTYIKKVFREYMKYNF